MTKRRRAPNLTERNAACLLMLKRGDGWLIPEPLRSTGTAKEIVAAVQWHHETFHAIGGTVKPQNITPLLVEDHKERSRKDNGTIAKCKRLTKKEEEFRARLLAKVTPSENLLGPEMQAFADSRWPKAPIKSRGFQTNRDGTHKAKLGGGVERRS
jgi:hypothetical protein